MNDESVSPAPLEEQYVSGSGDVPTRSIPEDCPYALRRIRVSELGGQETLRFEAILCYGGVDIAITSNDGTGGAVTSSALTAGGLTTRPYERSSCTPSDGGVRHRYRPSHSSRATHSLTNSCGKR